MTDSQKKNSKESEKTTGTDYHAIAIKEIELKRDRAVIGSNKRYYAEFLVVLRVYRPEVFNLVVELSIRDIGNSQLDQMYEIFMDTFKRVHVCDTHISMFMNQYIDSMMYKWLYLDLSTQEGLGKKIFFKFLNEKI